MLIDNYDSFSYNLVQMLASLGAELTVYRNDAIKIIDISKLDIDGIVISPGPGTPQQAGISVDLIKEFSGRYPILGVCLGHQCIGTAFGARIVNANRIMHGKTSSIHHEDTPLYIGVRNPFIGGRYHSLVIAKDSLPEVLIPDAFCKHDGEIMGIHHVNHPTYGVQFHPESVLTPEGKILLRNFLNIVSSFLRREI